MEMGTQNKECGEGVELVLLTFKIEKQLAKEFEQIQNGEISIVRLLYGRYLRVGSMSGKNK